MTTYQRRGTNGYPRIPNGLTPAITPQELPNRRRPLPPPRIATGMERDFNRFGPGPDPIAGTLGAHGFGYVASLRNRRASQKEYQIEQDQLTIESQELDLAKANAGHLHNMDPTTPLVPRPHPGPGGHPPQELKVGRPEGPTSARQRAASGWKVNDPTDKPNPKLSRSATVAKNKATPPTKGPSKATKDKAIDATSKPWADDPNNLPPTPQM